MEMISYFFIVLSLIMFSSIIITIIILERMENRRQDKEFKRLRDLITGKYKVTDDTDDQS